VLVFRDGEELLLQSRDTSRLDRYFPELREPLLAQLPPRCALDGELVIAGEDGLDFRGAPAAHPPGRVAREAARKETPVLGGFWDLLCEGDRDLRSRPFRERRARSSALLARAKPPLHAHTDQRRSPRRGGLVLGASRAPGSTA
jgi:ATP-dependent DNA ligase